MESNDVASQKTTESSSIKMLVSVLWIVSLVIVGFVGFSIGQGGSKASEKVAEKNVLGNLYKPEITPTVAIQPTLEPTSSVSQAPTVINNIACSKSGFAQKWEYLIPYTVKEGDSLQAIVEAELGDSSRMNEVLQLNGVGPLVAGSTLYLPPKSITKSNGKIKLLNGKLVMKNASSWQLSFNDDKKGQGILIPTFWFVDIAGKEAYKIGDCLSILLDDGFKVFSVSIQ